METFFIIIINPVKIAVAANVCTRNKAHLVTFYFMI